MSRIILLRVIKKLELLKNFIMEIAHNYIIKYLLFYIESAFFDRINGTQFYRDQ